MRFILVIEDDDLVRRGLTRALRQHGYGVLQTANVSEALAEAKRHRVDVVLTDYHLPDGTGALALAAIREHQDVPALLLSADVAGVPEHELISFQSVHSKPCPFDEIFASLDRALVDRRSHVQTRAEVREDVLPQSKIGSGESD